MFLIWSNQHRAWWRPNRCGYTRTSAAAGVYDFDEAKNICWNERDHWFQDGQAPDEIMVPIEGIPEKFRPTSPIRDSKTGEANEGLYGR